MRKKRSSYLAFLNKVTGLLWVILCFIIDFDVAAQSCTPVGPTLFGNPQPQFYRRGDFIIFGVAASRTNQQYNFVAPSGSLGGPLDGNGSGLSVSARMNSASDAGSYTVSTNVEGCTNQASNGFQAFYADIDNLSIIAWGGDSVVISWVGNPGAEYEYYFESSTSNQFGYTTQPTFKATGLIPDSVYTFTVYTESVNGYQNTTGSGAFLSFKSCSGSPPVGGITPPFTNGCGTYFESYFDLTATGGNTYQWYQGNSLLAGETDSTFDGYVSAIPQQFSVYVTTSAGCSGKAYTASVSHTQIYRFTDLISDGNTFCWGDSVSIGLVNSHKNAKYVIRAGPVSDTLTGIGWASESNDTIWTKFLLTTIDQLQVSAQKISGGCEYYSESLQLNLAAPVTNLQANTIMETSVDFSWNSDFGVTYEYAVTTSATPPGAGTTTTSGSAIVSSLLPATNYYIHVRPQCQQPSLNWSTLPFTTTFASVQPNCAAPIIADNCISQSLSIPAGGGSWDFSGTYPLNSNGHSTLGKELVYSFIPSVTGVYYIDVSSVTGTVDCFYKTASAGCNNSGWMGVDIIEQVGKYPIGLLSAGITYLILFDNSLLTAASADFKICRASVAAPATLNTCITTNYLNHPLPAFSPKEEFFIDNAGNLVASIDFSQSGTVASVGLRFDYYVNSAAIRRDAGNREYLDRHYSTWGWNYYNLQKAKVKLYFTNANLLRLVNEPNDGLADVATAADLNVSVTEIGCSAGNVIGAVTQIKLQSTNGTNDAASAFVSFDGGEYNGTYFIHGGTTELNYQLTIPSFEDFDSTALPKAWRQSYVTGTGNVSVQTSTPTPTTTPFGESRFVWWNSDVIPASSETRLISPPIRTIGTPSVTTEFYWYNTNTSSTLNDGVQVEYSTDGITWTIAGSFIPRYDATAGAGRWTKKKVTLPAAAGNKPYLFVAFKFRSQLGDNCGLDAVSFIATPACTSLLTGLATTAVTATTVSFSWTAISGATYENYVSTDVFPPSSGNPSSGTSVSNWPIAPSTIYYIHVRPKCTGGTYGSWVTIRFTSPAAAPNCAYPSNYLYLDTDMTYTLPAGAGVWNFAGIYPNNSVGVATPGREQVYPIYITETAVYYLEVLSGTGETVNYLYKPEGAGCSNTNWI
jgi:hypothetical protein